MRCNHLVCSNKHKNRPEQDVRVSCHVRIHEKCSNNIDTVVTGTAKTFFLGGVTAKYSSMKIRWGKMKL